MKLLGGAQAHVLPVVGAAGGNNLDAPMIDGGVGRGRVETGGGFLGNLSELKAGLTPVQQAMQKRAKAGLKADLEKQVRSQQCVHLGFPFPSAQHSQQNGSS